MTEITTAAKDVLSRHQLLIGASDPSLACPLEESCIRQKPPSRHPVWSRGSIQRYFCQFLRRLCPQMAQFELWECTVPHQGSKHLFWSRRTSLGRPQVTWNGSCHTLARSFVWAWACMQVQGRLFWPLVRQCPSQWRCFRAWCLCAQCQVCGGL